MVEASCAGAGSATSGCSPRWRASRASSSCPTAERRRAYGDMRSRSAPARRSRSRSWSRRSAQQLGLRGGERVLDVGTGSGYQAAVLAELAAEVVTVERVPRSPSRRAATLVAAGYARGRGARRRRLARRPERAPFPAIAVAAAAPRRPQALYDQLTRGQARGPLGARDQGLELVVRGPEGPAVARTLSLPVRAARRRAGLRPASRRRRPPSVARAVAFATVALVERTRRAVAPLGAPHGDRFSSAAGKLGAAGEVLRRRRERLRRQPRRLLDLAHRRGSTTCRGDRLVPRRGDVQLHLNRLWTFRGQRGRVAFQGRVSSSSRPPPTPRTSSFLPPRPRGRRQDRRPGGRDRARDAAELRR